MRFDDIILDLKILSNIQKGGKICTTEDGRVALETRETLQGIRRLFSYDSRKRAITKVNIIIGNAFDKTDDLLRSRYLDIYEQKEKPLETARQRHDKTIAELKILANEFYNSIKGLENLCETYINDANTAQSIKITIDKVRRKADDVEMRIERCHTRYTHKTLKVPNNNSDNDSTTDDDI